MSYRLRRTLNKYGSDYRARLRVDASMKPYGRSPYRGGRRSNNWNKEAGSVWLPPGA